MKQLLLKNGNLAHGLLPPLVMRHNSTENFRFTTKHCIKLDRPNIGIGNYKRDRYDFAARVRMNFIVSKLQINKQRNLLN